jgi:hypothetical protein
MAPLPWLVFMVSQLFSSVYTNPCEANPWTCTVRFHSLSSCARLIWPAHKLTSSHPIIRDACGLLRKIALVLESVGLEKT